MQLQNRFLQRIFLSLWLGRLVAILMIATAVVIGAFFLVIALVIGALMATIIVGRLWWRHKTLRTQRDYGVMEGSFSVEPERQRTFPARKTTSENQDIRH